jgi:hypothetical protein
MKMLSSCGCTLLERGRRRSVYTLDEVRPFLSLIGNARFEPICVAPLLREMGKSRVGILLKVARRETTALPRGVIKANLKSSVPPCCVHQSQ